MKKLALSLCFLTTFLAASHAQQQVSITIVNNTGYEVRQIYLSPCTSTTWGTDVLGRVQRNLPTNQSVTLQLPNLRETCYDIRLVDLDGDSYTKMHVEVWPGARIVFTFNDFDRTSTSGGGTSSGANPQVQQRPPEVSPQVLRKQQAGNAPVQGQQGQIPRPTGQRRGNEELFVVTCSGCNGKGLEKCLGNCFGIGTVLTVNMQGHSFSVCNICSGSGTRDAICQICRGEGEFFRTAAEIQQSQQMLQWLQGTQSGGSSSGGSSSSGGGSPGAGSARTCSFCNGSGVNPTRSPVGGYGVRVWCDVCRSYGSGHIHGQCPSCNGTGRR